MRIRLIKKFFEDQSGQGITEYGALLAFIGVLIGLVLSAGQGSLQTALKNSFSTMSTNMSRLVSNSSS